MIVESPTSPSVGELDGLSFIEEQFHAEPEWVRSERVAAWKEYQNAPMPSRKDENWRFSSLDRNLLNLSKPASGCQAENHSRSASKLAALPSAAILHFCNEQVHAHGPLADELTAKGVIFAPLSEAILSHPDKVKPWLHQKTTELGSQKFEYLHRALSRSGAFIYIPKGVEVEGDLIIVHEVAGDHLAIFPHTLIVAEDNASIKIVEGYFSKILKTGNLVVAGAHTHVGQGARVSRSVIQGMDLGSTIFQLDSSFVERDAQFRSTAVNLGGKKARYENQVNMLGSGSDARIFSITAASGDQEYDQRTFQTHAAPNTFSEILFKNALMDDAKTVFSGLIRVGDDAQQTDAYQTNRNLLLDPTAIAHALPGLEINANDVKCSHGATTGKLDEEQLFYLLQRGIPMNAAKELMVYGFLDEILTKMDDEPLAEFARSLMNYKFRHLKS